MSLSSFIYLWARGVVHMDLTFFVYLWAGTQRCAREPLLFICEHVVLCTCVLSLFCLFVGQRRLYTLVFYILVGPWRLCTSVYLILNIYRPVTLCAWVYPHLFICGPMAFVRVGFFPSIYLWACGAMRVGLSPFVYL